MSAVAARWARKLKVGGSGRKAVLMMLAHLADCAGELQCGNAALADACEISVDVLKDHIGHLEKLGLIERVCCYRDDGGRAANRIALNLPRPKRGRKARAEMLRGATFSGEAAHG